MISQDQKWTNNTFLKNKNWKSLQPHILPKRISKGSTSERMKIIPEESVGSKLPGSMCESLSYIGMEW